MKISIVGSIHRQSDDHHFDHLISTLLTAFAEEDVSIESRFYTYLQSRGLSLAGVRQLSSTTIDTDLLISIGGDGTFLRAARLIAGTTARIIGINTGRLGFLASLQLQDIDALVQDLCSESCSTEERTMLEVDTYAPDGKLIGSYGPILNEVAIARRDTVGTIALSTLIDGEEAMSFQGDGLLIATPTGSTAYALSVGGPIIHPSSATLCLCPIASHSLNIRPLIISDTCTIEIRVASRSGSFLLACDGKSIPLAAHTTLTVRKSPKKLLIAHPKSYSYYGTLKQKLLWGLDVRSDRPLT